MTKANPLGIAPFDAAEYLKDEESIAEFLNASIEMSDPTVLLNALSTAARARSMSQLAETSGLGRESLYKALKPGAQPRYDTVMRLLNAFGVKMVIAASKPASQVKSVGVPEPTRKASRNRTTEWRAAVNGEKRAGSSAKAKDRLERKQCGK